MSVYVRYVKYSKILAGRLCFFVEPMLNKVFTIIIIIIIILAAFFPHFSEYFSVICPNAEKCGKNADQNNSEYGHFLRSTFGAFLKSR